MKPLRLCLLVLVIQLSVACTSPVLLTSSQKKQVRQRTQLVKDQLSCIQAEIRAQRSAGALLVVHGHAPPKIDLSRHLFPGANPIAVGLDLEEKEQLDASIPDSAHLCYWFDDPGLALEPQVESCVQLRARIEKASATTDRLDQLRQELQELRRLAEALEESLRDVEDEVDGLRGQVSGITAELSSHLHVLEEHAGALKHLNKLSQDLSGAYRGTSAEVTTTLEKVHGMADLLETKAEQWQRQMNAAVRALEKARSPD